MNIVIKVYIIKSTNNLSLLLAKYAIKDVYKIDATILYNHYGKPVVKDYNDIHFNITHSGDYIICAVSDYPIGIDLEKIEEIEVLDLAKSYFTKEEYQQLLKEINPINKFFELWTIKESYLKFKGVGLKGKLNSFSIQDNMILENGSVAYFKQYNLHPQYKLTICSSCDYFKSQFILVHYDCDSSSFIKSTLSSPNDGGEDTTIFSIFSK